MKKTVRLENWSFDGHRIRGIAKDHPRYGEGEMTSSPVLRLDEIAGIAETKNTIYSLGEKSKTDVRPG